MRIGALSVYTMVVALAAISFASSAGAGLVLCGDVTDDALMQTHCGDNGSKKNKLSIEYLFEAATPASTWGNVKLRSGGPKFDHLQLHRWHRLDLSHGWRFGTVFVHDGRWMQPQLTDAAPSRSIPEPGTLALLSIGLLGAALSRRYKRG